MSATVNSTEIKKLMKHDGLAALVLFDFSKTPYTEDQIESFRNWPSLGKGNHKKSAFNVAYFYLEKQRPKTPCFLKEYTCWLTQGAAPDTNSATLHCRRELRR